MTINTQAYINLRQEAVDLSSQIQVSLQYGPATKALLDEVTRKMEDIKAEMSKERFAITDSLTNIQATIAAGDLVLSNTEEALKRLAEKTNTSVVLDGAQFKRLLRLGNITELDGSVVTSPSTIGTFDTLRLNNDDKIRPPVQHIADSDMVTITNICLEMDDEEDTVLGLEAIRQIAKALVY